MRIVPLLVVAGLLVSGCGSSKKSDNRGYRGYGGNDTAAVKQAIQDYAAALSSSDSAKACSLISDAQKQKIEAGGKCADVVAKGLQATGTDPYKNPQISEPETCGSKATVRWTVKVKGQDLTVVQTLVKENGQWKLDDSHRG